MYTLSYTLLYLVGLCLQERSLISANQSTEEGQKALQQTLEQLAATQSDLTAQQQQLADMHMGTDRAQADISAAKHQQAQLQQQIHALLAEAGAAQHEHAELQTDIAASHAMLEEVQLEVNSLKQERWVEEEALKAVQRQASSIGKVLKASTVQKAEDVSDASASKHCRSADAAGSSLTSRDAECASPQPSSPAQVCHMSMKPCPQLSHLNMSYAQVCHPATETLLFADALHALCGIALTQLDEVLAQPKDRFKLLFMRV